MSQISSYDELKDAISRAYPDLPAQLQRIARFALERPNELALGTVAVIAEAAQVQPSSLIRFANALGFNGFSQMQQVFRGHLVERSGSYRERINQQRRSGDGAASGGFLNQYVAEAIAELGHLEDSVRAADVKAAVQLLCAARRVHVLAQRRAFPVASYLAYALSQLELKAYLLEGLGGMLRESLRNIASDEVLVVTSFHSYSREVIDAAEAAQQAGVPVIAITDSALSPLKRSASVCFELGLASDQVFRSLVAPLCLAQAIVVTTGHRLAEIAAERAAEKAAEKATGRPSPKRRAAARGTSARPRLLNGDAA
jgi:DNA-binding MurR/RpiR family transcriptional regulator